MWVTDRCHARRFEGVLTAHRVAGTKWGASVATRSRWTTGMTA